MRVLGIETSCDETAAAVYDGAAGLLADEIYSQVDLHAHYGGVVPELAARDHLRKLLPLIEKTVQASGGREAVDGIAYTSGPGLVGALLVGAAVARSLAYAWDVPAIGVHHMEGHLLAPLLEKDPPDVPVRGVAGFRGPHVAGRRARCRAVRTARQFARRRGR